MRNRSGLWMAAAVGLVLALSVVWQARAAGQPTETVAVSKTYNHAPFDYNLRLLTQRPDFRIYRLTYPSPIVSPVVQNNTIPADYYVPNSVRPGEPKRPAVICLHILDGNEPLTDLICSMLAKRGIPAISFKLPYYGSRGTAKGPEILADNPKLFAGAIVQAGEDIRRNVRSVGLAAGSESRADRHRRHQSGRHHQRVGGRGRAAHSSGGLDPCWWRSDDDHSSAPERLAILARCCKSCRPPSVPTWK